MLNLLFLIFSFILFFTFSIRNLCNWMYSFVAIFWDKLTGTSLKKSELLYQAIQKNDFELFKTLINSGATFKYKTKYGDSIMRELVQSNNIEYLNYVHQKGLLFSAKKNAPFFWPNERGYANLEIKDSWGETLLHKACRFNNINAVKLLIDYHVPLHEPSDNGDIPLFLISESTEILDLFKKNSTPEEWKKLCTQYKNKDGRNLIHAIVLENNAYKETYILNNDDPLVSDIFKENNSNTIFHAMAKKNNTNVAQYILDAFPDLLNQQDNTQKTPLHIAVVYRCHNIFDFLLTYKGLDVTIKDIEGNTAAMYALYWNDSTDTFNKIIDYDKKALNVSNSDGETPLIFYIKYIVDPNDLLPVVTWLIEKESDLSLQDNDGNTSLHYAVMQKNKEVIDLIIKQNPELAKIRNNNNQTPFEVAPNQ